MSTLREALEELHKPYEMVGCLVCEADEEGWPCVTAKLLAAHPVEQAPREDMGNAAGRSYEQLASAAFTGPESAYRTGFVAGARWAVQS